MPIKAPVFTGWKLLKDPRCLRLLVHFDAFLYIIYIPCLTCAEKEYKRPSLHFNISAFLRTGLRRDMTPKRMGFSSPI